MWDDRIRRRWATSEPPRGGGGEAIVAVELAVQRPPAALEDVGADGDGDGAGGQPLQPRTHPEIAALDADDEQHRRVQRLVEEPGAEAQGERGGDVTLHAGLDEAAGVAEQDLLAELQRSIDVPGNRKVDADQV